jgi:uncharacterized protein (TIGR02001 family)
MARRKEAGTLKVCTLSVALIGGLALPAHAQDNQVNLSATATFTTDYVFRGISQTSENPAVQPEFDLTYGIWYLGMWGSNLDFGGNGRSGDIANIEIDYYGGIAPTWRGISFDIGGIYYTYPGAFDPGGEFDYFELKTGASYTFFDALTLGLTNYWSPENFGETGNNDVLEVSAEYAFINKWFNFFSPSISGAYGHQWGEGSEGGVDYNYWNVGLTLGFVENWSADVRYWDTDLSGCQTSGLFSCDARVVGTVSASF